MDGKSVNVSARDGAPVSQGRFQLSATDGTEVTQRLDLHFETELMRCVMRVPLFRLRTLLSSWDGERYHYELPASAQVWRKTSAPPLTSPPQPIVETFGMPGTLGRPSKETARESQAARESRE